MEMDFWLGSMKSSLKRKALVQALYVQRGTDNQDWGSVKSTNS